MLEMRLYEVTAFPRKPLCDQANVGMQSGAELQNALETANSLITRIILIDGARIVCSAGSM